MDTVASPPSFRPVLQNPDVVSRIRAEIEEVTGGVSIGAEHLPHLRYLEAVGHVLAHADVRIMDGYRMRPSMRAVTVAPSRGVPVVLERRR